MTPDRLASVAVGICRGLEKQGIGAADRRLILWLALGIELNIDVAMIHKSPKQPFKGAHNA
jgi:hypothetical protein